MGEWNSAAWVIQVIARETMLFAAVGFLIGGLDDAAIDLLYFARRGWSALRRVARRAPLLSDFPPQASSGRIVVFIAAWDESAVIGAMLRATLARFDHPDYALYVGAYPNDRATIDAIAAVAEHDRRIRLVVGADAGPTTKAGCLNTLWRALLRDEAAGARRAKAVVLHDAEDVVHPAELSVFDRLIDRCDVVQLPVLPLVDRGSRLVSGHYIDEFAESHAKQLVVREALDAGLPLAGVGCAIARPMLDRVAAKRGGMPFDPASLTEDYELGLMIAALGGRGVLARIREWRGGPIVAVRAYFPADLDAAVRQKARWLIGIALAGWDRVGWGRWSDWRDHWMRMRDRRAPLAVLVLAVAYIALIAWGASALLNLLAGGPALELSPAARLLLRINAGFFVWRLAMRAAFTGDAYGWREALLSLPRALIGNIIALMAARRALPRYLAMLAGAAPHWDKTAHHFPSDIGEAIGG
ncbi:glycosyl transferase family protein [Sphingomonas koreensis]|nr:glycosyl transferase family protein [Sphingomonas koreensis]